MLHPNRNKWDQFFSFVESTPPASTADLKAELKSYGVNLAKIDYSVARIVNLERSATQSLGWLERARKNQSLFEARLKSKSKWLSSKYKDAKQLMDAISTGMLGAGVQQHATVFFRNKDLNQVSEKDLRSFLDDCELLDLIGEDDHK